MSDPIVVVGAGHASGQLLASLKPSGQRVVLFGDESWLPYQRPPLSKKFLSGDMPAERLLVKPAAFFDDEQFTVQLDTRIVAIDRAAKTVTTESGDIQRYAQLVLATGSRVRKLTLEGSDLGGVHYLRSIGDVEAIRGDLTDDARIVIIGAGYIGLEVAAVLRSAGHSVTVVEMADRVMSRVVAEQVSAFFANLHTERGVDLRMNTGCKRLIGKTRISGIETSSGEILEADLVVVGIGIEPNIELADAAGLDVRNGIVVDDHCKTSDPAIFAIGDCTSHPNAIYERDIRLESVHNALEQAKTAAANMTGGNLAYNQVPWFWSDQYEFKLQIAGLSFGYDESILRGEPASGSFSCVYLREGKFIAIDCVNQPKDFMQAKNLIATAAVIDKTELADTALSFRDIEAGLTR